MERYSCHKISKGLSEGEALLSADPILFYQTDPATGVVIEKGHALYGRSVKDKILIFPGGKGSSVVQADGLYKLERDGTAPKGFIIRERDTVLVATAIIMEVPMVDRVEEAFYNTVRDGDTVRIDTANQAVHIIR